MRDYVKFAQAIAFKYGEGSEGPTWVAPHAAQEQPQQAGRLAPPPTSFRSAPVLPTSFDATSNAEAEGRKGAGGGEEGEDAARAQSYPVFGALPVTGGGQASSTASTPFSFKPQTLSFGSPGGAPPPPASSSSFLASGFPSFPPGPSQPSAGAGGGEGGGEEEDAMPLLAPDKAVKQKKDPHEVFEKDPVRVYRLDKESKTWVDMGKGSLGTWAMPVWPLHLPLRPIVVLLANFPAFSRWHWFGVLKLALSSASPVLLPISSLPRTPLFLVVQ